MTFDIRVDCSTLPNRVHGLNGGDILIQSAFSVESPNVVFQADANAGGVDGAGCLCRA